MKKLTKSDIIEKVSNWISDLESVYTDSEVGTNCLVHEWKELEKHLKNNI